VNLRICSVLLAAALCAGAQDKKLEFDVASVRVTTLERLPARTLHPCPTLTTCEMPPSPIQGGPGTSNPERMTITRLSAVGLIMRAFAVNNFDQIAMPDGTGAMFSFATGTKYDIVAKVPPGTTKAETDEMLKNLLIERFGLVYHMDWCTTWKRGTSTRTG
jgi:uncharacterized protein (TIGR03435 family)